jgi:hypothetical protein
MSLSCPIGPEFDALVSDLKSTAAARAAVALNNDVIPDTATAQSLLDATLLVNEDDKIRKSNDAFTLKKMQEEQIMLEVLKSRVNTKAQTAAIKGLIESNKDFQRALNKSIKEGVAVNKNSVTNLIGSNFVGDTSQFEKTKRFGIFVHNFADKVIKIANEDNKRITDVVGDYKLFEDDLAAFYKENYFQLENLSDKELFNMVRDVVEKIAALKGTEHIIIPELTVIGKGRSEDSFIIGRIDLLAIDTNGKFKVYDFKTKKVSNLLGDKDPLIDGVLELDNVTRVLMSMTNKNFPTLTKAEDIVAKKASINILKASDYKRTVYDTWSLQLMLYENILRQSGLEKGGDSSIIALFYQMDKDNKKMLGRAVHMFDTEDYYGYVAGFLSMDDDKLGTLRNKVTKLRNAVEFEIPTGQEIQEEEEKKDVKILDFLPTVEQDERVIQTIKNMFDSQIRDVQTRLQDARDKKKNPALIRVYEEQKKTLEGFYENYNKPHSVSDNRLMHNFAVVHEITSNEISNALTEATDAILKFRKSISNTREFLKHSEVVSQVFKRTRSMSEIVNLLDQVVRDAMQNPENKLDQNSEIVKKMNALKTNIEIINSMFAEVSLESNVKILASLGEKTMSRVKELSKEPLDIEIMMLERKIQDLKDGKSAGFLSKLKHATLSMLSKTYKDGFQQNLTQPQKDLITQIEDLEFKILTLRGRQNFNYDADSLKKYINAVTDPASGIYIGAQDIMNPDGVMNGMMLDNFIASAGNSDKMIAAFTMFLKNVKSIAVENVQEDFAIMQFDKVKGELLKNYTLQQLNEMMHEERTTKVFNYETMQEEEKTARYFVKPTSNEYDRIYKDFSNQYAKIQKEIKSLKAAFSSKEPGTQEFTDLEKEYYDKINERNVFTEANIQWLVDNTSLPYKTKFYEFQKMLPFEIRNELQKKYHEIEIIKASLDVSSEEFLSDEDLDRLEQIEYELRQLKQEAKLQNPDYEKYIDMFNQLYKFEEDTNKYELAYQNAKIKYEIDDPEKWQKWLDRNTVVKPTDQWYKDLSTIYDERNAILSIYYGENPVLQDLFEERKNLLAPHKVLGELKIKNLDENTILRLDQIEVEINAITNSEGKPRVKMQPEDAEMLSELNMALDKMSTMSLVKDYDLQFKSKTRNLENKYSNYINASVAYQLERDSATPERLAELEADYLKYENQFYIGEAEYKNWYESFHNITYKSIREDENYFKDNKIPKGFNYQRTVSDEMKSVYMEEKPGGRYRIKTLRTDEYYDTRTGEQLTDEQIDNFTEEELNDLVATGELEFIEGAYNKNFLKSADGIPMPKNIQEVNGVYTVIPGMENMMITDPLTGQSFPAVNPKYMQLMNNPEVFNFYNQLMNMYFKLQNKVDGRRTGYLVPGMAASTIENFSTLGITDSIRKQMDTYIDKELRTTGSQQDYIDNSYGALGDVIRLSGANQLPLTLQTTDSIGALMRYAGEAHYKAAMQEAAPVANMTIEYLEMLSENIQNKIQAKDFTYIDPVTNKKSTVDWNKRFKEINKVIEILKYEKRKFVNGQADNPEEKNRQLTKIVKQVMAYTSFVRMGFDVVNQTKNYISGNVQSFLSAGGIDDSSHYSKQNWMWAQKQFFGTFMPNYFADWGKVNDVSESTMLYRKFNPLQKEFDKYLNEASGSRERRAIGKFMNPVELGYMVQEKGDGAIGIVVMYSVLDSYKYKVFTTDTAGNKVYKKNADGTDMTVSAHEVYYQDANKLLQIRKDVEFTKEDEKFLRNIIYSEMRRAQGNYAGWDKTKFEENIIGKLVFYYRKYIIPQFLNRFGYLRPNWEGAEVTIGYWRALAKVYKAYGFVETTKYFFNFGKQGTKAINTATIGKVYTRSISHARRDAVAMAILTIASMAATQYVRRKDDDDEELGFLEGNAIRLLWGVKGETTAMFPLGGGSSEYIKNFTSLTTYTRELTAAKKLTTHALSTIMALSMQGGEEPDPEYDSELYTAIWKEAYYNRKSGAYEKGDMKLAKDFVDLTGYKNFRDMFDPNYRIDILKRNQ